VAASLRYGQFAAKATQASRFTLCDAGRKMCGPAADLIHRNARRIEGRVRISGARIPHHRSGWWEGRMSISTQGPGKGSSMASRQLRALGFLAAVTAPTLATPMPIQAQDVGGDVGSGRALARAWCAQCHRVEPGRHGIFEADFGEVANLSSTTALSLRVFLQSSHKEMPNVTLKPAEIDDIVSYILSLKRR
jgi:mono/diheme cytochrome c family protein